MKKRIDLFKDSSNSNYNVKPTSSEQGIDDGEEVNNDEDANDNDRVLACKSLSNNSVIAALQGGGIYKLDFTSDEGTGWTKMNEGINVVKEPPKNRRSKSRDGNTPVTAAAFTKTLLNVGVALGGRDREVVIYDITSSKIRWKGKNVKEDMQTLLQKELWQTSLDFHTDGRLAVGTAFGEVRVYDERTQRRPVYTSRKDAVNGRVTAVKWVEGNILVGDAKGYVLEMEGRMGMRVLKRYTGPSGSVKGLVGGEGGWRGGVGMDRWAWVGGGGKGREWKGYVKQRGTGIIARWAEERDGGKGKGEEEGEGGRGDYGMGDREENEEGEEEEVGDDEVGELVLSSDDEIIIINNVRLGNNIYMSVMSVLKSNVSGLAAPSLPKEKKF